MGWGIGQIVGYRKANRHHADPQSPLLGMGVGCVFLGLILALVTTLLYLFSRNHPAYSIVTGGIAALLLVIGAVVGIRQGEWRGNA
jgi:hypothetical protein